MISKYCLSNEYSFEIFEDNFVNYQLEGVNYSQTPINLRANKYLTDDGINFHCVIIYCSLGEFQVNSHSPRVINESIFSNSGFIRLYSTAKQIVFTLL